MKPDREGQGAQGARTVGSRRGSRSAVEDLVEAVLEVETEAARRAPELRARVDQALRFDTRSVRVVVLGGGTGLSTVAGGNAQRRDWVRMPFVGLKEEFPRLQVVVCTTDDGGSTGRLLKDLPMIAIGDLRKSFVALVRSENL